MKDKSDDCNFSHSKISINEIRKNLRNYCSSFDVFPSIEDMLDKLEEIEKNFSKIEERLSKIEENQSILFRKTNELGAISLVKS